MNNQLVCSHNTQIDLLLMTMMSTLTPSKQLFLVGKDETEAELSMESRSFINRVNHHRRKTVFDLGNVYVLIIGISSIHEEELSGQLPFHYK